MTARKTERAGLRLITPSLVRQPHRVRVRELEEHNPAAGELGGNVHKQPWLFVVVDSRRHGVVAVAAFASSKAECELDGERCNYVLSGAFVAPEYRGLGLQRWLIEARLAHARRKGFTRAATYTATWNTHSACNILRSGFEPVYFDTDDLGARFLNYRKEL
jgi:GNAT superfamily N-acetyltransferase